MCGIAGLQGRAADIATVRTMVESLRHRGPDGQGIEPADEQCVFGHARLSIMDPSEHGKQPMRSSDGSVVSVVNGEIYNFRQIRRELEALGIVFHSGSDSEVLANGYRVWGRDFIERLDGIFAFALYDTRDETLLLARDPAGVKPLYYRFDGETFAFASEIKALRAAFGDDMTVDPEAMRLYFAYRYIPAPSSIYRDVKKLMPGHWLEHRAGATTITPYWQPRVREESDEPTLQARLRETLEASVKSQLMSDVPVGVLLSGGIDSSAVTAIAAKHTGEIEAFCCGFNEPGYDERPFARVSARSAGVRLHETVMTWEELFAALPEYVEWFDEPFFNYSAVAIHKLSRMAKARGIKVLLAGEGADEMFAGYRWYDDFAQTAEPQSEAALERFFAYKGFYGGDEAFDHLAVLRRYDDPKRSPVVRGQMLDFGTFLPDDVLCRDDRASMAAGVELRVPFLSKPMLETCFLWPETLNHRQGERKALLKRALQGVVEPSILSARKKGFGFPLEAWDEPIRDFARSVLAEGALRRHGFASEAGVRDALDMRDAHHLWLLLSAELWVRRFVEHEDITALCAAYREKRMAS